MILCCHLPSGCLFFEFLPAQFNISPSHPGSQQSVPVDEERLSKIGFYANYLLRGSESSLTSIRQAQT